MTDDHELTAASWELVDQVRALPVEQWPAVVEDLLASLTAQLDEKQLDQVLQAIEERCRHRRAFGQWHRGH